MREGVRRIFCVLSVLSTGLVLLQLILMRTITLVLNYYRIEQSNQQLEMTSATREISVQFNFTFLIVFFLVIILFKLLVLYDQRWTRGMFWIDLIGLSAFLIHYIYYSLKLQIDLGALAFATAGGSNGYALINYTGIPQFSHPVTIILVSLIFNLLTSIPSLFAVPTQATDLLDLIEQLLIFMGGMFTLSRSLDLLAISFFHDIYGYPQIKLPAILFLFIIPSAGMVSYQVYQSTVLHLADHYGIKLKRNESYLVITVLFSVLLVVGYVLAFDEQSPVGEIGMEMDSTSALILLVLFLIGGLFHYNLDDSWRKLIDHLWYLPAAVIITGLIFSSLLFPVVSQANSHLSQTDNMSYTGYFDTTAVSPTSITGIYNYSLPNPWTDSAGDIYLGFEYMTILTLNNSITSGPCLRIESIEYQGVSYDVSTNNAAVAPGPIIELTFHLNLTISPLETAQSFAIASYFSDQCQVETIPSGWINEF